MCGICLRIHGSFDEGIVGGRFSIISNVGAASSGVVFYKPHTLTRVCSAQISNTNNLLLWVTVNCLLAEKNPQIFKYQKKKMLQKC